MAHMAYEGDREREQRLRQAAEAGDPADLLALAVRLAPQASRAAEAEHYFRQAIAAGSRSALSRFGNFLAPDPDRAAEAESCFRQAIAAGDGLTEISLGQLYEGQGRLAEAEAAYVRAAAHDVTGKSAGYYLGNLLSIIPGREDDAERWYRRAIAAGNRDAAHNLGVMISDQPGREAESEELMRWAES